MTASTSSASRPVDATAPAALPADEHAPGPQRTVQTVTGPVPVARLGSTLMHEHVALRTPGVEESYPGAYPRAEVVQHCVRELTALKASGIDTLVDHTTYDLGRDAPLLAEVSERSGLQIVAATGIWVEVPRYFLGRTSEHIAEMFIRDLVDGIAGTGVRAGIIKCGVDRAGLSEPVERVLRACALAHAETGAPISTHSWAAGRTGLMLQQVLRAAGVDLDRVVIGHSGDTEDLDYLNTLLHAGSFLGMDRFGAEDFLPDQQRVATVAALCAQGYANRLVLSHDAHAWSDRITAEQRAVQRPHHHYLHLTNEVLSMLRAQGVEDADVERMLVHNPVAVFGGLSAQ